jgi:hypothetical protein
MSTIKFPFGNADVQTKAKAAVISISVANTSTIVTVAQLDAAATINLDIDSETPAGSELTIITESDGTARTVTFGTGFTSKALSGTISKKNASLFVYNGSTFINVSNTLIN